MEGPQEKNKEKKHQGIIPRAMKQVFKSVEDLEVCGWTVRKCLNGLSSFSKY